MMVEDSKCKKRMVHWSHQLYADEGNTIEVNVSELAHLE